MTKLERIQAFVELGKWMLNIDEQAEYSIQIAKNKNPWYTSENILKQFQRIGSNLTEEKLSTWLAKYDATETDKVVGLVLAGNLPLVGFHDILCVLLMGFKTQIKISSDDAGITTLLLQKLAEISPELKQKYDIVEKLKDFDLVIATGSNNTARYFEYYFGKKPNIIRKNRNSIAVITGNEREEELKNLGNDIFDFFGLGCRSVSKIYVPENYDFVKFFEAIEDNSYLKDHYKYNNNYDYNKSIYLINGDKHFDNGFLLVKKDTNIASPLAVVYYEEYTSKNDLQALLNEHKDEIQCLVSELVLETEIPTFKLGESQCPTLEDYADGIDVLHFLNENK